MRRLLLALAAALASCRAPALRPEGADGGSGFGASPRDAGAGVDGGAGDSGPGDAGWDGDAGPPPDEPLFDHALLRDVAAAACAFQGQRSAVDDGVALDVWDVSYDSLEFVEGWPRPIRIRGFAARPVSGAGTRLPGIVLAHGLGGFAEESHATGLAALTGMFVLAYTGPGGGSAPSNTSEGLPSGHDSGRRMFDTLPSVRGSWFWAHAAAAMRGLTCLQAHPGVDPERLGMTGFSAGAVATLTVAAVDDRLDAAVPLSGTGAWDVATLSPSAWQHTLLANAGLSTGSLEWIRLIERLDARGLWARGSSGARVLMINGTSDEFFPLTAHVATYDAIPAANRRTSLVGNFDHGCYKLTGGESASTIEARADQRARGGQRMWFRHWFGTDARYAHLPAEPQVSFTSVGAATYVVAAVDGGGSRLSVDEVKVWWSNDDGYFWGSLTLDKSGGAYAKLVPFPLQENTMAFVDVVYKTDDLLFPERFSLSSRPLIPAGLVPRIRAIGSCQ